MRKSRSTPVEEPTTEREEVLAILADTIRDVHDGIEARDPEDAANEKLQIKWVRTLGYLSGQYRKLLKDTDIDEIEEDMDLLKVAQDVTEGDR